MFRLCEEFEQIAEKALSTPMDTAELIELREYMTKVEKETVIELEEKLQQAGERLAFLIEYSISSIVTGSLRDDDGIANVDSHEGGECCSDEGG